MSDEESFAELSMSDEEEMFTSVLEPRAEPVAFTLGEDESEEDADLPDLIDTTHRASLLTDVDSPQEEGSLTSDVVGSDHTAVDEEEPITLYEEAANNQVDAVSSLLGVADIDAADSSGDTGLLLAVRNNHAHIVALLLQHGGNTALGSNTTPLHEAVKANHSHLVQMLLLAGADSNLVDSEGLTPLYYTVQCNHVELARALLLAGANPTHGTHRSALDAARDSPHTHLYTLMESAAEKLEAEVETRNLQSPPCIPVY